MNLTLSYYGRSGLQAGAGGRVLALSPNLNRDRVSFDAALRQPLAFREAMSALHEVVVSDLRYQKRDKTAYEAWKKSRQQQETAIRNAARDEARREIESRRAIPLPVDLEKRYEKNRKRYWSARQEYSNYLYKHDVALWRKLMPCDPIVTIADDVVFFECYSADESSYACLTVQREGGFGSSDSLQPGTTNVDYSWDLFEHFQSLRTYRETRLRVDPAGFEVATHGRGGLREEKIDLPKSWLRGFVQIQAAMAMPLRRVPLSIDAVYSLLAWLKRRRERSSPRAIRFELRDGQPASIVLEPWEQRIDCHGLPYRGPDGEPVRIWGRRRLLMLARLLPIADGVEVHLLGTGFPSFWVVYMGPMRLTLALSGWTVNDWTGGASLDALAPPGTPSAQHIGMIAELLQRERSATFGEINSRLGGPKEDTASALNYLACAGQIVHDLGVRRFRWRQVMATALGEAEVGPSSEEVIAAQRLIREAEIRVVQREPSGERRMRVAGEVGQAAVEIVIDADGVIREGKCKCSHHYRFGIRRGPCRHLQTLRWAALHSRAGAPGETKTVRSWYDSLLAWAGT